MSGWDRIARNARQAPKPRVRPRVKTRRKLIPGNPKLCLVYGLHGPDGVIRYIGQTRQLMEKRLALHKKTANRNKLPLHKWVKEMGDQLEMKALCTEATWDITEIIMIDRYRQSGGVLFNLTRGGEDTHLEMKRCKDYRYPW